MRLAPVLALLALAACQRAPEGSATATASPPGTVQLRIATLSGPRALHAEVAVTPAEQERGLMGRTTLPPDRAMLFPFALPRAASFWMKDTALVLDLLFIAPDGRVAAILHGKPRDRTPLSTGEPVSAVVEMGAGVAARLGVTEGDRVQWGDCREGRVTPGMPINPRAFCPAT